MNTSQDKHVLILTSGGIDSTALIKYYLNLKYEVRGLFVDFGQLSNTLEEKAIGEISQYFDVEISTSKLKTNNNFNSGEIIGRNLMLISLALLGFNKDFGTIAIGIHSGTGYSDCEPNFIKSVQQNLDIYYDGRVKIEAPFLEMQKTDIWQFCSDNDVPTNLTYSCENGTLSECGVCLSCKDKKALYEFGSE
ncbi:7-cyano-7-deazaguanine synthase [Flavobacteriaceae bacterium 3-367]